MIWSSLGVFVAIIFCTIDAPVSCAYFKTSLDVLDLNSNLMMKRGTGFADTDLQCIYFCRPYVYGGKSNEILGYNEETSKCECFTADWFIRPFSNSSENGVIWRVSGEYDHFHAECQNRNSTKISQNCLMVGSPRSYYTHTHSDLKESKC